MASTFMTKLPAELRLVLYGYALSFDHPLKRVDTTPESHQCANITLLCTNKQIHSEAVDLLYSQNTFMLDLNDLCPIHNNQIFDKKADPRQRAYDRSQVPSPSDRRQARR